MRSLPRLVPLGVLALVIIELTDAQTSLTSAEASRVQAVVNYRTALAFLERATAHPFSAE